MHNITELTLDNIELISKLDDECGGYICQEFKINKIDLNRHVYGILIDDNLIGYAYINKDESASACSFWTSDAYTISTFYISEEYRNQGYGTELMEFILHEFNNISPLFLHLDDINYLSWYNKFNFNESSDGFIFRI